MLYSFRGALDGFQVVGDLREVFEVFRSVWKGMLAGVLLADARHHRGSRHAGRPCEFVSNVCVTNFMKKPVSRPLGRWTIIPPSCQIPSRIWYCPGGSPWFRWQS